MFQSAALLCVVACILLAAVGVRAETLYKCQQNGVPTFSDQPCQGTQLGSEEMQPAATAQPEKSTRKTTQPGYRDSVEQLFKRCSTGDHAACRQLGIAKPGQHWTLRWGITRTITNFQPLSGRYARYPTETEVHVECLPSRRLRTVYVRKDLDTVFLRDGDMVVNSESGVRGLREYGSRFRSLEEAAEAVCREQP